jgi:glycosyltransferase involved in cell wall biosynthesis
VRIAHVVVSDHFAGVERYISTVAAEQARRGLDVVMVGGGDATMLGAGENVPRWVPAASLRHAIAALIGLRHLDVVHAHMTAAEAAALATRVRHGRSTFVTTRHFAQPRGSTGAGRAVARVLRRVPHVEVAISAFVQSSIGVPSVLLPNGVAARPERPPPGEPTVLVMQRHAPEKQGAVALRAWARSGLQHRGWRLVVAGRGPDTTPLRRLASDLGIPDRSFVGFVPDADGLLHSASLLLASAPAEPFGLSVVEAMARAVPVVAADGGAHRETVGSAGLLFPPGDADAAAEQLRALADDPAAARVLGRRGQARQRELFELTAHVDALATIYSAGRDGRVPMLPTRT